MMDQTEIYFLDSVELAIPDLAADGFILDIGGGGEGVIGRLRKDLVIAIDTNRDELMEAPEGPLKIVMDARKLLFLDSTFSTATAFFSFMYIDEESDQSKVFEELYRVLRPGGHLHMWDVILDKHPETNKSVFAIRLKCHVGDAVCETAYGRPWPTGPRDIAHYTKLAKATGFRRAAMKQHGRTFYALFQK